MNPLEFDFKSSLHQLTQLNKRLEEQKKFCNFHQNIPQLTDHHHQTVMVPLGPLAFIPSHLTDKSFVLYYLGCKTFIKMTIEEASQRNSQKIADLEEQIQQLTNNLNRIKLEINQINQEGAVIRNCGFGLFEIQEIQQPSRSSNNLNDEKEIKPRVVVSQQEREETVKLLSQQIELNDEQREDLLKLDRLIDELENEKLTESISSQEKGDLKQQNDFVSCSPVSLKSASIKEGRKVSFKETVQTQFFYSDSAQLDGELESEQLNNTESILIRNSIPIQLKSAVGVRREEPELSSSKTKESKSTKDKQSEEVADEPLKRNPIGKVVERQSNISVEQIENDFHIKEIKQAYHVEKQKRITREKNEELYRATASNESKSIFKSRRQENK